MKTRGICTTCVNLKTCFFSKEPPIWQCEEFSIIEPKVANKQTKSSGRGRRIKLH